MKFKRAQALLEHTYPNGLRVFVTNKGVSLWDEKERRWVIDASVVAEDGYFSVSGGIKKRWTPKGCNLEFEAHYPKPKPRSPGKERRR